MNTLLNLFDRLVRVTEPVYVVGATVLVSIDAYVFFSTVLREVISSSGLATAAAHVTFALWLLFNVLFNHSMCVFTSPGCTGNADPQVLHSATTFEWRWCRKCQKPKPPMTHHCSICNRCVLKMDHHCPWMANCVGFYNYKYFFLYVWWMWVGSIYSALVLFCNIPWLFALDDHRWESNGFLPFFMFILSSSICIGLSALMGWHVVLIVTGQGTIDFLDNSARVQEAKSKGLKWSNPYHLGPVNNWKETFDAQGPLWWFTWMLPTTARKKGNGYVLPKAHQFFRDVDINHSVI